MSTGEVVVTLESLERLTQIETAARNLFAVLDHNIPGWRDNIVCQEGDEVDAAWVELAESLGEAKP